MNTLLILLIILAGIGFLAYLKSTLGVATVAAALGLLVVGQLASGFVSHVVVGIGWLVWLGVAALNLRELRYRLVVRPALKFFSRIITRHFAHGTRRARCWDGVVGCRTFFWRPGLATLAQPAERIAVDGRAGVPGRPGGKAVHDGRRMGHQPHRATAGKCVGLHSGTGFLGLIIPKAYGGKGFSARAHSRVVGKIASRSGTAAIAVMVPNSLGPAELLLRYGTDAQKNIICHASPMERRSHVSR